MLDVAIIVGLASVFLAVSVPLVRGALIRQRTAECARKIMEAAEVLDSYASMPGGHPVRSADIRIEKTAAKNDFTAGELRWWSRPTELGGRWDWYSDGKTGCSVVISGRRISDRQMIQLDVLLDDGNLTTGLFQRGGGNRYHYFIKDHVL